MLKTYGYKIKITGKFDYQTRGVITAFRRRFNPKNLEKNYFSSIDFKILSELNKDHVYSLISKMRFKYLCS